MKKKLIENVQPLIAFALLLLTYVPTFFWMKIRWFGKDSYYSHGILIPFVVGYLIWQQKDELKKISPSSHRLGIPLIITGLIIHILSSVLRVYFTSGFSLLITLAGVILHFYGLNILKALRFPLSFLIFMVPLPQVVIVNISFRMKMFAAGIATHVINGMGILAIRQGSVIRMSHAYVVVDDVCSGLRSLISLTALGCLFSYFFKGPNWKRLILFLSTIPIAIITNVCRVVFLALVSQIWGHEVASGHLHDASGFGIFIIAFILLTAVGKLLE